MHPCKSESRLNIPHIMHLNTYNKDSLGEVKLPVPVVLIRQSSYKKKVKMYRICKTLRESATSQARIREFGFYKFNSGWTA